MYSDLKKLSGKIIRENRPLVKWKGYSNDFNSWIPFKDLSKIIQHIYNPVLTV